MKSATLLLALLVISACPSSEPELESGTEESGSESGELEMKFDVLEIPDAPGTTGQEPPT